MPYRQALWRRQVLVQAADGTWLDLGITDDWSGGKKSSDPEVYHRGDGSTVNLGGDTMREDGTAKYLYDEAIHAIYRRLDEVVGSAAVRVLSSPTDDRRVAWANPYTMTGKLAALDQPESGGGKNAGAQIELTLNLDNDLS